LRQCAERAGALTITAHYGGRWRPSQEIVEMNPLDRPVWASLSGAHAQLSLGDALARRYRPDVNQFASACRDDDEQAQAALAGLLGPGDEIIVLQVPPVVVPPGCAVRKSAQGVQMVATQAVQTPPSVSGAVRLGDADAPEMLALAQLTQPGPFFPATHTMGTFWGLRIDGRLAAMAGERLRPPGHTEVSGVCTHPDFRGRGLARTLSALVAARIQARGETPFLHAWKTNAGAIQLYESLGFRLRAEVDVKIIARAGEGASSAG
jgi:predicted GNAT family acetyltransferase